MRNATTIQMSIQGTAKVSRALRRKPAELHEELANALDHIRRKQFKTLKTATGLKFGHMRKGLFGRLQGYTNKGKTLEGLSLRMVSYSSLVGIHEEGGTIRGKNGGDLAIPAGFALTAKGKTKKEFRTNKIDQLPGDTFKFGDMILWRRTPRSKVRLIAVLRRSVRIRPRLRFVQTWRSLRSFTAARLDQAAEKAIRK